MVGNLGLFDKRPWACVTGRNEPVLVGLVASCCWSSCAAISCSKGTDRDAADCVACWVTGRVVCCASAVRSRVVCWEIGFCGCMADWRLGAFCCAVPVVRARFFFRERVLLRFTDVFCVTSWFGIFWRCCEPWVFCCSTVAWLRLCEPFVFCCPPWFSFCEPCCAVERLRCCDPWVFWLRFCELWVSCCPL